MSTKDIIEEPGDYAIAAFPTTAAAEATQQGLSEKGIGNVEIAVGEEATRQIDTRAKWFADTDETLQRYRNKLRDGYTLLIVEVPNEEARQLVDDAVRGAAEVITHFGQWVTETMRT